MPFTGLKGRVRDNELGVYLTKSYYNTGIYVMGLNDERGHTVFDPLDVSVEVLCDSWLD